MDRLIFKTYAMDVTKKGTHIFAKASRYWNIPLPSFLNHLNGRTKSKKLGP
jgi:hypothetical protein